MALCLSGGGFRAALFHLGALRRLNEIGILSKIDTISAVSGGSILAAFLADRIRPWPSAGTVLTDFERRVATPFEAFTAKNLRTGPILKRALPWNWFHKSTGVEAMAARYEAGITAMRVPDLPDRPRFVFCATDMAFGVNWIFERERIGDYQAGYLRPAPNWPVALAVAASSCFPPVFNPLPMRLGPEQLKGGKVPDGKERSDCLSDLRLTDGGNYDNLGLESVWKTAETVLVSDGGATFDFHSDKNLIWRLSRYAAIQGNQALAVRKRWLMSQYISRELKGTYWGIGSPVSHFEDDSTLPTRKYVGYSDELVKQVISEVRTDMDAFSEAEIQILQNHGYMLAEAALRQHASWLISPEAPFRLPYPSWVDDNRIKEALKDSKKRKLPFGRW